MELGARPKTSKAPPSSTSNPGDEAPSPGDVAPCPVSSTTIDRLPDEVLEHVLGLVSPYSDLANCSTVCSRWYSCCRRVAAAQSQDFHCQLGRAGLLWTHLSSGQESGPGMISKRYSHCAVYCPQRCSMYVFGGCTSTSSTFNDLWELSLSTRTWRRPQSMGAYPSPKACASLVLHGDLLVLFGGWTHPSLYPLHQSWKLFSELHIYSITAAKWELVVSEPGDRPPAMAGHSATVHGHSMVVFGGLHKQRSIGHYTSSNDVWLFDLTSRLWGVQLIGGEARPLPRYGQSQIQLGRHHLLVLGGCGGPNTEYTDIWLLDMRGLPWTWAQMEVRGSEHRARDIWSHPACRVGDRVVVLGKGRKEESAPQQSSWNVIPQLRRGLNRGQGAIRRTSAPAPHHSSVPAPHHTSAPHQRGARHSELELAVDPVAQLARPPPDQGPPRIAPSFRSTLSMTIGAPAPPHPDTPPPTYLKPPSNPATTPNALIPVKVSPAHSKSFGPAANTGNQDPSSTSRPGSQDPSRSSRASRPPCQGPGAPGNPETGRQVPGGGKNRQKMLENRQRQLASLQKMEEKMRGTQGAGSAGGGGPEKEPGTQASSCPHHRMATHLLDISHAVSGHWVEWLPLPPHSGLAAPQESILYSLVLGRTELVMFGGLQKDVSLGPSSPARAPQPSAETVSNCLHFLNPPLHTI